MREIDLKHEEERKLLMVLSQYAEENVKKQIKISSEVCFLLFYFGNLQKKNELFKAVDYLKRLISWAALSKQYNVKTDNTAIYP